ncbi:histidine phosphatase family protein [soil metagenome]
MKLVLIRHAEAVMLGEQGTLTDFDRMLTPIGHRQSIGLAAALQRIGCIPGMILTSPLVRTMETANLLADVLTPDRDPTACEWLAAGERRPKKLMKTVTDFGCDVTFLVGHMPDLGEYAEWLLGVTGGSIDFDKAAAALIKFPGAPVKGTGEFKWLVPPAWFLT